MPAEVTPISAPTTKAKRQALIDEFGQLQQRVDAFKVTKDRHAVLREQIAGWYADQSATQGFVEAGKDFTLQVSERSMEREITNMPWLFKFLGIKTFLKKCTFRLTDVDENVPKPMHGKFLTEERTGPRKIKAIANRPAPATLGEAA